MMAFLEVRALEAYYRQTQALFGVDFRLDEGSITAILGANGAGKTTTLRAICRMVRTDGGVVFDGQDLSGLSTERVVRLGIAHVPEGRGTFVRQSVEENLVLGAYTRKDKAGIAADMESVYGYFPRLGDRRRQQAGTLSGGEQQMLAIGRALM
ncbi:MAG: ATP-binding cassette domain-containing protein, partial [Alphaproteobacteria bacterium]|nr:ATP-binding cassette domain-containing protein [Alphaproteobacteria bacterium]